MAMFIHQCEWEAILPHIDHVSSSLGARVLFLWQLNLLASCPINFIGTSSFNEHFM